VGYRKQLGKFHGWKEMRLMELSGYRRECRGFYSRLQRRKGGKGRVAFIAGVGGWVAG
jgi:hypothetical protein